MISVSVMPLGVRLLRRVRNGVTPRRTARHARPQDVSPCAIWRCGMALRHAVTDFAMGVGLPAVLMIFAQ
jgi:hypothetical protein